MIRRIAAIAFIFLCTTVAWMILGSTISWRTGSSNEQLQGRVASTWGTMQEQNPASACYKKTEISAVTEQDHGKTVIRHEKVEREIALPLDSSHLNVALHLDHRQKGLLWYSTYAVDFSGDYKFRNDTAEAQTVQFYLPFPAEHAAYDALAMYVNGKDLPVSTSGKGASVATTMGAGESVVLRVAYHSQGLGSWRYKLGDGIAQARDFALTMVTNFKDIDFADDTLSPTAKEQQPAGWKLTWQYSNLVSGFQIGMTMPEKLQPGPLAGQISYFAPVSLFFFFFLMFILTTLRNIELHPMNYFFLAAAFFAFHLLLAYLVDHISIHLAMVIASLVSIALVVSYLRLVVGARFAAIEAGGAQLIYLVLFSYAFFWKGFTGLSITIISIATLFVVMQATGRIRWSEKLASLPGGRP
ncbi:MAG: inner membrane CreD family protein [Acidobacteriales bacterium]|nr:inner membrane CreD family protein [Candidatus Koribacter versatilis]MBI3645429.1 inner membrane CreD family protein [Terriglobales bacterium]